MRLPLLISVPHAGTWVPPEVEDLCILDAKDIVADGDEQSAEIYRPLRERVAAYQEAEVARAIVDLNRAPDDFRKDGVIKTHTCWDLPVYREAPDKATQRHLLDTYHRPYHEGLSQLGRGAVILGLDCHTMVATGPPVAPDSGVERPQVCIGSADGACPRYWAEALVHCFQDCFPGEVTLNKPFGGGFITRTHGEEIPWAQIEISRGDFATPQEKAGWVLSAIQAWVDLHIGKAV